MSIDVENINVGSRRAILQLSRLDAFTVVDVEPKADDGCIVSVDICDLLASRYEAAGQSPYGVMATERVNFFLPSDYPMSPPTIRLRPDFPEQRFHYSFGSEDIGPMPCLTAEPLADFFHSQGLGALCGQLQDWLRKAAKNQLANEADGWEANPIHRPHFLVLDVGNGPPLVPVRTEGDPKYYIASIQNRENSTLSFSLKLGDAVSPEVLPKYRPGVVAIHIGVNENSSTYAGVLSSISDMSLSQLYLLCEKVGASRETLETSIASALLHHVGESRTEQSVEFIRVPIVLDVRRPFQITGTDVDVERFFFCLEYPSRHGLEFLTNHPDDIICAFGINYGSPDLAISRRLSGIQEERRFSLGGAGSLGSAVGASLARSGWTCSAVIDPDICLPHNTARHAFFWDSEAYPPKKVVGATCLSLLGSSPLMMSDAAHYDTSDLSEPDHFVIHTTASPVVLEALVDGHELRGSSRLIDSELYLSGRLSLATCEGLNGNPSCLDMKAVAFAEVARLPHIGTEILEQSGGFEHVLVGAGCGTTTMVMSDARLKTCAGQIAEEVLQWGERFDANEFQESGHGCVFAPMPRGFGTFRRKFSAGPFMLVACANSDWTIRLSPNLIRTMDEQRAQAGAVETGGYLIGRVNERRKEITCVLSLPPPPDSRATATEFVLGINGAKKALEAVFSRSGGYLIDVGTWHTHLAEAPPSPTDKALTKELARTPERSMPSVMLVSTPSRFHALLADPVMEGYL